MAERPLLGKGTAYESRIRLNLANWRTAVGENDREDCRNLIGGREFDEFVGDHF